MTQIETFAVEFGNRQQDIAKAAERIGISRQGAFILATYQGMIRDGDIDEENAKTAREMLLELADKISDQGVSASERQEVAELVRYLSQFALERPVPSQ
ncbi:hypothetical protein [Peteryoungia algae]|uniref:Uncharacterized protein n=1 Tax=Peteryoungia algae TaxID=2919917 RepID=A0ABT0CXE4_9HYPH|nr:hypothetical protein [Rhizobium sp. SSM4.3]MCJ8237815.1 hypothetical protein [Rhizobium sp. SSM4.3]